ncbi:acyl-CoA carboxylase epsilon subunit [Agromyces sp. LHK192]|uniref:acyl-CoA carboxylase epsilon subunit n=1 Tax=Agromyces sp. LHK192 TaxID=2498704 RepID=UPI000FD7EFC1|nr:acyl-CoA carboxylase epsilon subunit [Agromyces sp. LHK192]
MSDESTVPAIGFLTPVTDHEAAATTAVLTAVLAQASAEAPSAEDRDHAAWIRGAGALRTPLTPGHGRWAAWGR